ncbi:O-antigen ligase family protein [Mariniblastus sp.]|nr:O-antigen ligase family protein [Mariniblastus sp.]
MNNFDISLSRPQSTLNFHNSTNSETPLVSWAILGLALFFISSHLSIGIVKYLSLPNIATYAIGTLALAPLWWQKLKNPPQNIKNQFLNFIFIGICTLSCLSSVNSVETSGFDVAAKTLGLLLVLLTLLVCAPAYQIKEIQHSLVIYSLGEFALLWITFDEWNPNAFSNRIVTSAATFFYTCPIRLIGIASFCTGLYFAIRSGSRTTTLAAIFAICTTSALGPKVRNKRLIFASLIFLAVITAILAGPIQRQMRKLAIDSLGSKNSVARFFLNDKSKENLRAGADFFDRSIIWTQSIKTIKKHPILGVGLGNESKYILIDKKSHRSHNAWLSLAVEGGILVTMFWALLYFYLGYFSIFNSCHDSSSKLEKLMLFLLICMFLSSVMESSGIGSLQAPNNIICMFLGLKLTQPLK